MEQRQVAKALGVTPDAYLLWEKDRTEPETRYCPAIFAFLGYDPFPAPRSLAERIAAHRRYLGLAISAAAKLAKVDEGTFSRWEKGLPTNARTRAAMEKFLAMNRQRAK